LLDRGIHIFSLNPKQLDRFRDRHTVAGAKDDRRDAFVLADSLRTDRPAFRRVQPDHPHVVELRELSRVEDDLGQERRRLSNRLREQLHRFFPQALTRCPAADEPWFWALIERVPTPAHAQRLPVKSVAAVLKVYRVRRFTVKCLRETLQTPPVHVAPGTVEAARAHIALLLPRLRLLQDQGTSNPLDLLPDRYDAVIAVSGGSPRAALVAHPLAPIATVPVCAPALPSARARRLRRRPAAARPARARRLAALAGPRGLRRGFPAGGAQGDSIGLTIEAASAGPGFEMVIEALLSPDLARRTVVVAHTGVRPTRRHFVLQYEARLADDPALAALAGWLRARLPGRRSGA